MGPCRCVSNDAVAVCHDRIHTQCPSHGMSVPCLRRAGIFEKYVNYNIRTYLRYRSSYHWHSVEEHRLRSSDSEAPAIPPCHCEVLAKGSRYY